MHPAAGEARGGWSPSARPARTFLLAGLILAALMALVGEPVRGWLLVAVVAASVGAGIVAVRRQPSRDNPAWLLLVGAALQVPAYVLWYPAKLRWDLDLGNPAVTDVLFLAGYLCFVAAMAQVVRRRSGTERHIHLLDTLIISVGLGVLVWVVFISPSLHDEALAWPARLVAVSYPLVDLLLFGAVARLLVQAGISTGGDRLLALWVGSLLVADLAYSVTSLQGTFDLADPVVALYVSSFAVLGAVLLHPSALARQAPIAAERSVSGARRIAIVGPATLIAPTVLVILGLRGNSQDVAIVALLAAVIFGLVLLRVWLLMVDVRQHRRIQERLTESVALERRRAEENQELLASLSERQMLSDRLFRIQRKISTRAPLHEVLESVTHGAAELLREDVVGLRLIDEHDPGTMVMVASVGVPDHLAEALNRLPVGVGVGGRALVENRLCIEEDYLEWDNAIEGFKQAGLASAMGTPVHLAGKPIGSLVVASTRSGRRYSAAEQDALSGFAEHVSLALNDARTVQAMHRALDQAVHQAMHDDLTGLPNRACFYDRTAEALVLARAEQSKTAVLLFDLDRFKEINDTLGHRYGDRVLRAIGPRIADLLGPEEVLARLGGDEFCVLMPRVVGVEEALELARCITHVLEDPFEIDDMDLLIEASCGVTMAPDHGDTADLLLQRSDVAMYVAKTAHVDVVVYDDELDRHTRDRLAMAGDLRTAIANDQLVLHFQPQADLETGAIEGVEALVRWQHPRLGLVPPDQFIPMAEDTGLIRPLTSWVLGAALAQLRRWEIDGDFPRAERLSMAVNLSTQSLLDESICDEVLVALDRFGIAPRRLVLEITETTLMADPGRAHRVLTTLAAEGVRFAIDDFGTGYSSLAALKTLPVHHLKIDKSFVRCMHEDSNDATIVRSVIDLARTLGLHTVAEGVEHQTAWTQLIDLGCDAAQGYVLSRPLPAAQLSDWMGTLPAPRLRVVG